MSAVAEVSWNVESRTRDLPRVFENAPVGFAFCDVKGRVLASNPALHKMLAISGIIPSSSNLSDLIHVSYVSDA